MSCKSNNDCKVSPPKRQVEKLRDPTPQPVVKREVKRNPTPQADTIERVRVTRQPQLIIERVVEQPRKPAPKVIERVEYEPSLPPIVINSCLFVDPSGNRHGNMRLSIQRPRSSLSSLSSSRSKAARASPSSGSSFTSTSLEQGVKLRLGDEASKYPPITIYDMFRQTVEKRPDHLALAYKSKSDAPDSWNRVTFKQYWDTCNKAAKSFIKLGLNQNQCVAIIGFNSPEWFYSLLGAIFAGGVGCGIYTTNSAEACEYVLKDSKSQIVVVENKMQLLKILKAKENGVQIKKIVQYSGPVENDFGGLVIDWNTFIETGSDVSESDLQARVSSLAPNKCASLIYTSGTTGNPKAAMISHDNITFTARYVSLELSTLKEFEERIVSFLPLSHIAAQICDVYNSLFMGISIYFAQPDALRGTLNQTMKEVKPTFFFGVPRVWEKMQEQIEKSLGAFPKPVQDQLVMLRKGVGDQVKLIFRSNNRGASVKPLLAKFPQLAKLHADLGLDECRNMYSGAAPISKETLEFFISLGIPLCEVYGLSETTGPHSLGALFANRVGSIGRRDNTNKSKIVDATGELCMFGRHVFMGYLNDEAKTREAIDSDGWFHSGDQAKDEENFLFITGRIKELIITAGGENVPPVPIEDDLKSALPKLISNSMVVGDKQKFLVVLVSLKTIPNPETTLPTDNLMPETVEFLSSQGSKSTKLSEILDNKDPAVYKIIDEAIKKVNAGSTSNASKIQKFYIIPKDFSLLTGELTPTLKLKRQVVSKLYADQIAKLYSAGNE